MTRDEQALLESVFRAGVYVSQVGGRVLEELALERTCEELLDQYAFEQSMFEAYGVGPRDEAEYRGHVRPVRQAIARIQGQINAWLRNRLLEGEWVGFGIKVPMAIVPRFTTLLPGQWLLLRVDQASGVAEGGGHRYEKLKVSDLTQMPADEANQARAALDSLSEALRGHADQNGTAEAKGTADGESVGREIAAAIEKLLDRRLTGMTGATAPLTVAVTEISPEALMRVQVAAIEIQQTPQSGTGGSRGTPEDRPRRPPGRPSMMARLVEQMFVRAHHGQVADGVAEEARQLHAWGVEHRQEGDPPVPSAESIENGIRSDYAQVLHISNGIKSLMPKNN